MLPIVNTHPVPDIPLTAEGKKAVRNSVATLATLVSRQNPLLFSFNKQLLSTYYALGTILGGENAMVNKMGKTKEKSNK